MQQISKSRYFAILVVSFMFSCAVISTPHAAEPALTPLTAFQMALKQTPQLVQSRARIAQAKGAVKSAKGYLLPNLSASLTASGSDNALNVFGMKLQQRKATFNDFGANQFDITNPNVLSVAPTNLNNPGWYRNYETKLQLNIPVYNGGQILGGLHQAQAMLNAARAGQNLAKQKLLFEVLQLFEGLRTADGYVHAGQQGVQAAQSYVDLTQKLFKRGVVARTDVLQARIHLDDAKLGLAEADKRQALATTGLRIVTGLPEDKPIQLTSRQLVLSVPGDTLSKLKTDALLGNPGLQALDYRVRAAQAGVTQARAAYLPHFNLMLSHQWDDNKLAFTSSSNTIAGVLSWDVFDFGTRSGALDRAQASVIQGRGALRQAQDQVRLKIDQAWQEVHLASTRLSLKHDALANAGEAARLARLRYGQGLETFTQLISAQAALDKARADVIAARYQQVMAQAGLLLAAGQLKPAAVQLVMPASP